MLKIADTTRDASFLREGMDAHADRGSMVPERRLELEEALIAKEPMASLPPVADTDLDRSSHGRHDIRARALPHIAIR